MAACWKMHPETPDEYNDQIPLRAITYAASDLQIYVLLPQYNLRLTATQLLNVWATPVILPGHSNDFTNVERQLSLTHDHRLILANFSSLGRLGYAIADRRMAKFIRPMLGVVTAIARLLVKSKNILPGRRRLTEQTKPN